MLTVCPKSGFPYNPDDEVKLDSIIDFMRSSLRNSSGSKDPLVIARELVVVINYNNTRWDVVIFPRSFKSVTEEIITDCAYSLSYDSPGVAHGCAIALRQLVVEGISRSNK